MKYFIDTNIFLRYFVKEDSKTHGNCSDLIKIIVNKRVKAATSHLVLAEIAWTLTSYYKVSKRRVVRSLRSIETMSGLSFLDNFKTTAAHDLFQRKNAKYIDCLIASIPQIQDNKITVVSYDKDFDKLGVKRVEPDKVQP
jgi:predicted nucleic-acid-binding protein